MPGAKKKADKDNATGNGPEKKSRGEVGAKMFLYRKRAAGRMTLYSAAEKRI